MVERGDGVGQDGHETGLAELRLADHDHSIGPGRCRSVRDVTLHRPACRSRRAARAGSRGSRRQRRRRIAGGCAAMLSMSVGVNKNGGRHRCCHRDQPERRDLGAFINAGHVAGEPAGDHHPLGPFVEAGSTPSVAHAIAAVDRDRRRVDRVEIRDEAWKQPVCSSRLWPSRRRSRRYSPAASAERAHDRAPGHG